MVSVFPEFTKLKLTDREMYSRLVKPYPSLSDLSFGTLMIWWNFNQDLKIAKLHDNLVIYYHLPGDKRNSGLSLVGTEDVDKSITSVFEEQKQQGQRQRLVHVPEFVVGNIKEIDHFIVEEEVDYAEYIIPVSNLYPLSKVSGEYRSKVNRFLRAAEGKKVESKELNLNDPTNQRLLLEHYEDWRRAFGAPNDKKGDEKIAIQRSVKYAALLGIRNICLFLDDELCGFVLYQVSQDGRYMIGNHVKARKDIPRIFQYLEHLTAAKASAMGISYLNIEMDLGIPGLRSHKLSLGPADFFRKYRVTPKA